MAKTLVGWFARHDPVFGYTLKDMDPETQGRTICERYGFDFGNLRSRYVDLGRKDGDTLLLHWLNDWAERNQGQT